MIKCHELQDSSIIIYFFILDKRISPQLLFPPRNKVVFLVCLKLQATRYSAKPGTSFWNQKYDPVWCSVWSLPGLGVVGNSGRIFKLIYLLMIHEQAEMFLKLSLHWCLPWYCSLCFYLEKPFKHCPRMIPGKQRCDLVFCQCCWEHLNMLGDFLGNRIYSYQHYGRTYLDMCNLKFTSSEST